VLARGNLHCALDNFAGDARLPEALYLQA
jgi:hypothetical protein